MYISTVGILASPPPRTVGLVFQQLLVGSLSISVVTQPQRGINKSPMTIILKREVKTLVLPSSRSSCFALLHQCRWW